MKTLISILAIFISIPCIAQTQSGNTETGKGTYLYPNGATYSGEWKEGKRHGKGVMNYPKGANEANTQKTIDTTCICSAWTPQISTVTEKKIWDDIGITIRNFGLAEMDIIDYVPDKVGNFTFKTKLSPGNLISCYNVVEYISKGEFKTAAEKSSEWAVGYVFPAVAAYKSLIDVSVFTTKLVIENWMNDLYLMPIYQKVEDLMMDEIQKGDKNFNAYMFSGYIHGNPELRKKMQAREEFMFNNWVNLFENSMCFSWKLKDQKENPIFSRILWKMSGRYPKETTITDRMVFYEMMWIVAEVHKKRMLTIFQYEMEIKAEIQTSKFKKAVIKSVCKGMLSTKK